MAYTQGRERIEQSQIFFVDVVRCEISGQGLRTFPSKRNGFRELLARRFHGWSLAVTDHSVVGCRNLSRPLELCWRQCLVCGRVSATVRSVAAAMRGHASAWSSFALKVSIFLPRA